jgi:DNA-directed RNA polymerase
MTQKVNHSGQSVYSSATYGEKPSSWQNPPKAPPQAQGDRKKATFDRYGREEVAHSTNPIDLEEGKGVDAGGEAYYRQDATNMAYEQTMKVEGRDKFKEQTEGQTKVDQSPIHFNSLVQALPRVSEDIKEELKLAKRKGGRLPTWVNELSTIDPDVLAYIGLLCCFNGVLQASIAPNDDKKDKRTVVQLLLIMGQHIEQELLKAELQADDKEQHAQAVKAAALAGLERPKPKNTNKRLVQQVTQAHNSPAVRVKSLRNITQKNGFSSKNFGVATTKLNKQRLKERRIKLAAPLLSTVLKCSGVFEKRTEYIGKHNSKAIVVLTEEAAKAMEANAERMSWMAPIFKPMLSPPKPWTSFDTGCYHDTDLAAMVPLIKGGRPEQRSKVVHQFNKGPTPNWVAAINALQATPLSINEQVLEAVQWCWEAKKKGLNKFPRHSFPERPRLPDNWQVMAVEKVAAVKAEIRNHFKLEMRVKGAAVVMEQDLQTARELVAYETEGFYLPWNSDFRGRMYPVSHFSYHRDSHLKALFCYKRGYLVEGNNAFWLKVHLANCGDFEKISKQPLDVRAQWTTSKHEELLSIAKDYQGTFDLWSSADKPFEYLAAVFEYARWVEEGDAFVSYLPLSHDATNSGVQIYSGLNLSETEGALVNLTPSHQMADIYQTVADKVVEELKALDDAVRATVFSKRTGTTVGELADRWLNFKIGRSHMKRPTMTYGYSSNKVGMRGQFMEDLMKPEQLKVIYGEIEKHPLHDDEQGQFDCAWYMGDLVYKTISKVLLKTGESMEYLQAAARAVTSENKAIQWTSDSGFPALMDYRKSVGKPIYIFLHDRAANKRKDNRKPAKVTYRRDLDQFDVVKSCSSIAPNFVHSQDAALMQNFICNQLDAGTAEDFFMIHDSFSISGDVWDLYDGVRNTFINMFSGECLFQRFEDEIRQQLNDPSMVFGTEDKPITIPTKGSLDLEAIRYNDFCFS